MSRVWRKIKGKRVHKNPWYSLWEDTVIRTDNKKAKYYVVRREQPTSIIIPLQANKIYLVSQYRYPIKKRSWVLPMCTSKKYASGISVAKHEMSEETGLKAKRWSYLGGFYWMNGMSDMSAKIYLATQ